MGSSLRIPAMRGAEYTSPEIFAALWRELDMLARAEAQAAGGLRKWLGAIYPSLHLLGRVTFHLAENKRSPETPFARSSACAPERASRAAARQSRIASAICGRSTIF